jgi:hypothetical protein
MLTSDVSSTSRLKAISTGAATSDTFPGLRVTPVSVAWKERRLTPAGGVSGSACIIRLTGTLFC